ncbi:MAG: ATP-binding protein [Pseudomonadota bacterium]
MEDSLAESNASLTDWSSDFAMLFEHLEEGIVVLSSDHRILFRSNKCHLQFGLSKTAEWLDDLTGPEQLKDWQRCIELAQKEGSFRVVVPGANDGFLRLYVCAQPDGRIVISIRPAEPPIDRDDILGAYERVLAKYDIGLWRIHVPSGELWWSDKCYELLGLEPGPICTSVYINDLSEQDKSRISSQINLAMSQKGQYAPCFTVNNDSGVRHVQDRAAVLQRNDDGTPISFVGATVNRTRIVELESQLATLRTQIDEAEALRHTGRLTGAVAHDLNNVITVILGNAELMLLEDLDPEHEKSITNIQTAALHAGALSSRMLNFVRDLPLSMTSIDAVNLLEESVPLLRALVGENAEVILEPLPDTAFILGDRHRLEQALYNVVLNAGQAIQRGGHITLSLNVEPDVVQLLVVDDGPGIDEAIRGQIFSPFFSTKENGVGLGLSSVKRVVDEHSGYVSVDAPEEGGTVFTIAIPRSFSTPEDFVLAVEQTEPENSIVWVVEDELLVRVVTEQLLTQAKYEVRAFATPERLLQALDTDERLPDLVLSDVIMPAMSGPDLRKKLLARMPSVRFVFMTGYADDLLVDLPQKLDSRSLLHKPFHRSELLRAVAEALAAQRQQAG